MRIANDTYHVRTNVPTPPALCLGTPVLRQKEKTKTIYVSVLQVGNCKNEIKEAKKNTTTTPAYTNTDQLKAHAHKEKKEIIKKNKEVGGSHLSSND